MFVYIAITLGDYTPTVAPFYVTSKVNAFFSSVRVTLLYTCLRLLLEDILGLKSNLEIK